MVILSKHSEGDSPMSKYFRNEVLDLLEGVNVFWLTEQVYSSNPELYSDFWGSLNSFTQFIPTVDGDLVVESGVLIIPELGLEKIDVTLLENSRYNLDIRIQESGIIHELTHRQQVLDHRLKSLPNGHCIWEGEFYSVSDISDPRYWNQPWEQEAYIAQTKYSHGSEWSLAMGNLFRIWRDYILTSKT